jgi:hypothetical protein
VRRTLPVTVVCWTCMKPRKSEAPWCKSGFANLVLFSFQTCPQSRRTCLTIILQDCPTSDTQFLTARGSDTCALVLRRQFFFVLPTKRSQSSDSTRRFRLQDSEDGDSTFRWNQTTRQHTSEDSHIVAAMRASNMMSAYTGNRSRCLRR